MNVDFVYTTGLRRQVAINNMGCCDVVTYELGREFYGNRRNY